MGKGDVGKSLELASTMPVLRSVWDLGFRVGSGVEIVMRDLGCQAPLTCALVKSEVPSHGPKTGAWK